MKHGGGSTELRELVSSECKTDVAKGRAIVEGKALGLSILFHNKNCPKHILPSKSLEWFQTKTLYDLSLIALKALYY